LLVTPRAFLLSVASVPAPARQSLRESWSQGGHGSVRGQRGSGHASSACRWVPRSPSLTPFTTLLQRFLLRSRSSAAHGSIPGPAWSQRARSLPPPTQAILAETREGATKQVLLDSGGGSALGRAGLGSAWTSATSRVLPLHCVSRP